MTSSDSTKCNKKCSNLRCNLFVDADHHRLCHVCHSAVAGELRRRGADELVRVEFVYGAQKIEFLTSKFLTNFWEVIRWLAPFEEICYRCGSGVSRCKTFCNDCFKHVPACACGKRFCIPVKLPNGHRVIWSSCLNCALAEQGVAKAAD